MRRQSVISVSSPPMVIPARRHRCEICLDIYECWLCRIHADHRMHAGARLQQADETVPVFVCEECISPNNCEYVRIPEGTSRQLFASNPRVRWWNYRTGKIETSVQRGLVDSKSARKAAHRKAYLI